MTSKPTIDIVWYKRDLRITDHRPLFTASNNSPLILPMYVFEPSIIGEYDFGSNHLEFITESIQHLQQQFKTMHSELFLFNGEMETVLQLLSEQFTIRHIHSHIEVGNIATYKRDKRVLKWCNNRNIPWTEYSIYEVQRPHPNRDHWAKNWNRMVTDGLCPTPTQLNTPTDFQHPLRISKCPTSEEFQLSKPAPNRQPNKRGKPLELLHSFLDTRGEQYRRDMANPLAGEASCSRMSPHLTYGTVSIREVYQYTQHFIQQHNLAKHHYASIRSFVSRLHWRGHFMQKLEDQVDIEWKCLDPRTENLRTRGDYPERLERWQLGTTGVPFIDASMRFLRDKGWINFRMRAMLVSFASYHCWLDWRDIHPFLARQFTDYEPGIHLCQLQMQSGTTGINSIRVYNPIKQGLDQDPNGEFIRKWVPEIASRPNADLHAPRIESGQLSLFQQPESYPSALVDLASSARDAKSIIYGARKSNKEVSQKIYQKHGSRKKRNRR